MWEPVLNSLGNLMLLEYDLNRSLKNEAFASKRSRYRKDSLLSVAKKIAENDEWTPVRAREKLSEDTVKLCKFLFPGF
jgi:hypothetical protein